MPILLNATRAAILLGVLSACPAMAMAKASEAICRPFKFTVYFAGASADVTPAAQRVIRSAGQRIRACRAKKVEISIRDRPADAALDQRRAAAVSTALAQAAGPVEATAIVKRRFPFEMFQRRVVVRVDLTTR